jgi:5-methylcytosine-specific restriction endonuclease McrA
VHALSAEQVEAKRARTKAWDDANRAQKNGKHRERYQHARATDPEAFRVKWRSYYEKDPAASIARSQKWQAANAEHLAAYREANADQIKATSAKWAKANPERVRARTQKWQAANPDYVQRWRKQNPEAARAIKHRYRANLAAAEGIYDVNEIKALFEKQDGRCAYCGRSIRNGYDVDHIVPLSRGGSNWITNIQLCCASCNRRKWAHDHAEFARRRVTSKKE